MDFSPVGKITMIFSNTGSKKEKISIFRLIIFLRGYLTYITRGCAAESCNTQPLVTL
jgi:hypothetical protein